MTLRRWPLATASYRSFKPPWGRPIRTSTGQPRVWSHEKLVAVKELSPYGIFNANDPLPYDEYLPLYMARLEEHQAAIVQQLDDLTWAQATGSRTLVILCYCDLRRDWCHRTMFADWVRTNYGLEVPEYTTHPPASEPTLFDVDTLEVPSG